jgi:hypothetical protein
VWGLEVIKMTLWTKTFTLCKFLFYPQDLFLLILAVIGTIWMVQSSRKTRRLGSEDKIVILTSSISLMIILVCFFMTPTQFQYYEQAIPYVLISSIPAMSKFKGRWSHKKNLLPTISVLYLVFLTPFVVIFLFVSREKDKPYEIRQVKKVTQVVEENSHPGETILCGWPAYAVFSNRETSPGLETWGWEIIPFLSSEKKKSFKLIDSSGVKQAILTKKPSLIVEEKWFLSDFENLIKANYRFIKATRFTKIYVREN